MSEKVIRPDLKFVNQVIASGGESMKKCFQCATCTVVCNVTPEENPFPRKEMVQAQWGLKEELFRNPDIWLCHQCSDCTAYCPRGAKPGEVLGAVRKLSLQHYSVPGLLAKAVGDPKYLLALLAVPVAIFVTYLAIAGKLNFSNVPVDPEKGIVYSNLIPTTFFIDPVFIAAAVFAVVVFVMGISRYWKDMARGVPLKGSPMGAIVPTVIEILTHKRFGKCDVAKGRQTSHLFVFYSFVGLAITTTFALVYLYGHEFFGIEATALFSFGKSPYPLTDPMKLIGNLSALGLVFGIVLVIINRFKNQAKAGMGSYYDWLFILIVFMVAASGILSELFRLADVAAIAYPTYIAHLSFVFFLFAYAPFSKMAHMLYRATAMVFERVSGRK